MCKISVIVPVYNVEKYLEQCLDSIIAQSFSGLEIILVNDGSTDQSAKICDKYKEKDSRIIVIHQENGGVSSARNTGINIATGNYITFVDSDDWLEIDMYERLAEIINSNQVSDVIMCDFINVKSNRKENISAGIRAGFYTKRDIITEIYPTLLVTEDLGRVSIVSACICLFRKELLIGNKITFNVNLRFSEDYLFMAEVMIRANSFYYLKHGYFYNYRQYELSRSKKYQPEWWHNLLYLNNELKKILSGSNEYDFRRQIKLQLIHSALFLCNGISTERDFSGREKTILFKRLFEEKDLKEALTNIVFDKQPLTLRLILYFMKNRMALSYSIFRNLLSKIKLLGII